MRSHGPLPELAAHLEHQDASAAQADAGDEDVLVPGQGCLALAQLVEGQTSTDHAQAQQQGWVELNADQSQGAPQPECAGGVLPGPACDWSGTADHRRLAAGVTHASRTVCSGGSRPAFRPCLRAHTHASEWADSSKRAWQVLEVEASPADLSAASSIP